MCIYAGTRKPTDLLLFTSDPQCHCPAIFGGKFLVLPGNNVFLFSGSAKQIQHLCFKMQILSVTLL